MEHIQAEAIPEKPPPSPERPSKPEENRPLIKPGYLPPVEPRPMPESPLENPEKPPLKIHDPAQSGRRLT